MHLFIDSASVADIDTAIKHGIPHGVTTNPSLIAKEPPHPQGYLGQLKDIVRIIGPDMPLSVQPPLDDLRASVKETVGIIKGFTGSRQLAIKIPVSWDTLPLIRATAREIPVNATCIYTPEQAIAAIHAGARFISFFWCRINDSGSDVLLPGGYSGGGAAEGSVRLLRDLIDREFTTVKPQIICGSIRSTQDATAAFAAGAHIVTAPLKVMQALAFNAFSTQNADKFEAVRSEWAAKCVALSQAESPEQAGFEATGPSTVTGETPATPDASGTSDAPTPV